jgi:diamine N-acetyltransferase
MMRGEHIFLRALEPDDLEFLYEAENDARLWQAGILQQPISKFTLKAYLENAHQTLHEAGQLRLVICKTDQTPIGLIDLFDYDANHQRAAVGIMLLEKERGKGLGADALKTMKTYAAKIGLHQLYCHVQESNLPSLGLFARCGFINAGLLKEWIRTGKQFEDVYFMQCVL